MPDLPDRPDRPGGTTAGPGAGRPAARVLLVDDEPALRGRAAEALRAAGHEVVAAPDGATALGLVGPHWQPDVLLLGARLPDLDAPAFLRAYDQTPGPHAPVVLVTTAPDAGARLCRGPFPVAGVLPKPFDVDELLTAVTVHRRPPGPLPGPGVGPAPTPRRRGTDSAPSGAL